MLFYCVSGINGRLMEGLVHMEISSKGVELFGSFVYRNCRYYYTGFEFYTVLFFISYSSFTSMVGWWKDWFIGSYRQRAWYSSAVSLVETADIIIQNLSFMRCCFTLVVHRLPQWSADGRIYVYDYCFILYETFSMAGISPVVILLLKYAVLAIGVLILFYRMFY